MYNTKIYLYEKLPVETARTSQRLEITEKVSHYTVETFGHTSVIDVKVEKSSYVSLAVNVESAVRKDFLDSYSNNINRRESILNTVDFMKKRVFEKSRNMDSIEVKLANDRFDNDTIVLFESIKWASNNKQSSLSYR